MAKNLVSGPILAYLVQSRAAVVSYYHVQYQEKLMIQSWENIVTDGQTDRGTRVIS